MRSKNGKTPRPPFDSSVIIYTNEIEKAQKKYNIFLFDVGNDNLKILLEENNDNGLSNIFNIILNFEELKNLHKYFLKFNSFEEVKLDMINLY